MLRNGKVADEKNFLMRERYMILLLADGDERRRIKNIRERVLDQQNKKGNKTDGQVA